MADKKELNLDEMKKVSGGEGETCLSGPGSEGTVEIEEINHNNSNKNKNLFNPFGQCKKILCK